MNDLSDNTKPNLKPVIDYAKKILSKDFTGHGFDHVQRVARLCQTIIDEDQLTVDGFIVQAAAYLHDTVDDKVVDDLAEARQAVTECLLTAGTSRSQIAEIFHIIEHLSFSKELLQGADVTSLEGMIVRDADRLDALGAIGIMRTSYYGGSHQHPLHIPECLPKAFTDHADYRKGTTVINHFYEKLFLLPEKMRTNYGKQEALRRTGFMKQFLKEFYTEWEGKLV